MRELAKKAGRAGEGAEGVACGVEEGAVEGPVRAGLIYEGKGKRLFATDREGVLLCEFKDDLTAFNAEKKGSEAGKGELNCRISTALFELLASQGIPTHLICQNDPNTQLVRSCQIIPIEIIIRNVATGSLVKRLGIAEGAVLDFALVEFCLKDDALGDPFINDEHILLLGLLENQAQIEELKALARRINQILLPFFASKKLRLIDFKIELGRTQTSESELVLADELSPDSCRLWDLATGEKLDKDRFRQDLGGVRVAYEEVLRRILGSGK